MANSLWLPTLRNWWASSGPLWNCIDARPPTMGHQVYTNRLSTPKSTFNRWKRSVVLLSLYRQVYCVCVVVCLNILPLANRLSLALLWQWIAIDDFTYGLSKAKFMASSVFMCRNPTVTHPCVLKVQDQFEHREVITSAQHSLQIMAVHSGQQENLICPIDHATT